eukprot:TRINITY_DN3099_c0_g1_i6.p1 TRINITY_DN3099_c0_g1~~TRINITY_DN3099_c0_g1_i6.p1  ORF type:complete len:194 (+),score=26.74 TRINITY_DN3099_c0_g1_i6:109-690(+)
MCIRDRLMTMGFAVVMPIGAIFVAACRAQLVTVPKWWLVHAVIQSVGACLAVAGLLVAWKQIDDDGTGHWHDWHGKLGLSLVSIVVAQILVAVLRPGALYGSKEGTPHTLWSWVHRLVGVAIFVLAVVNMYKGLELNDVSTVPRVLFIILVVIVVIAYVVVLLWRSSDREQSAGEGVEDCSSEEKEVKMEPRQ